MKYYFNSVFKKKKKRATDRLFVSQFGFVQPILSIVTAISHLINISDRLNLKKYIENNIFRVVGCSTTLDKREESETKINFLCSLIYGFACVSRGSPKCN